MKTGGGTEQAGQGRGIHWHIDNPVYYIATDDKRQDIPWVSAEYSGTVTEYVSTDSTLTAEQIASAEKRKMDCIDCHNRATHVFQNPDEALNTAMANGTIPADLPYIKQYGVQILGKTYATEAEAAAAIAALPDLYRSEHPEVFSAREADIKAAAASMQTIFDNTQFPFMNVTWESHTNNVGHKDFPGCFRCHDGKHLSSDNQAIRLECNLCHSIPQVTGAGQPPPTIPVSTGTEPQSHHSTTWLAEHRFKFDTTCAECHKVDNPGGTDSSSFCSNSACHATQWKYVGLDAPKVRQLTSPPKVPSSGMPNPIPHPVGGRTDCEICHGPGKIRPFPDSHADFTIDMCVTCHKPTLQELPPTVAPTPTTAATSTSQALATAAATPTTAPAATATIAAAPGGPPAIPHDLAGRDNCLLCHDPNGGLRPAPQDHVGRANETCQACHKPAVSTGAPSGTTTPIATATPASGTATPTATPTTTTGAGAGSPPPIPHDLAGRDNCLLCHNPNGGLRPAPQDHAGRTNDTCQACHKPAAVPASATSATSATSGTVTPTATSTSAAAAGGPPAIPHDLAGRDNCLLCHDPKGTIRPAPQDHVGRANETCQVCHKPAAAVGAATPTATTQ
jgi:hypothetical protein